MRKMRNRRPNDSAHASETLRLINKPACRASMTRHYAERADDASGIDIRGGAMILPSMKCGGHGRLMGGDGVMAPALSCGDAEHEADDYGMMPLDSFPRFRPVPANAACRAHPVIVIFEYRAHIGEIDVALQAISCGCHAGMIARCSTAPSDTRQRLRRCAGVKLRR